MAASVKDTKYNCNDIPTKKDTATVLANRSIAETHGVLVKLVETCVLYTYEQGLVVSKRCSFCDGSTIDMLSFLSKYIHADFSVLWHFSRAKGGRRRTSIGWRGVTCGIGSWRSLPSLKLSCGHAAGVLTVCHGCEGADAL